MEMPTPSVSPPPPPPIHTPIHHRAHTPKSPYTEPTMDSSTSSFSSGISRHSVSCRCQPTDSMVSSPGKPVLQKGEAVDLGDMDAKKKMERGLSHASANEPLVSAARTVVQADFTHISLPSPTLSQPEDSSRTSSPSTPCVIETPLYTFTLPDLTSYPEDFRGFLEKDLIEVSALISLEQSGRLNWWADTGTCQRLWPLATTGDGNCLLHAASLAMWGFHDRLLTLRTALYTFLTHGRAVQAIYRRWRWQAAAQNSQSGLALTELEWEEEWSSVLRLASTEPRLPTHTTTKRRSRLSTVSVEDELDPLYESLEEIHVLALAHVLRRPIIVVADTVLKDAYGEALAPIPFGGIYLPLEVASTDCDHCPLLLTYDSGHFSALVTMQSPSSIPALPSVIPVTDSEHCLLPIQFSVDPGPGLEWARAEQNPHVLAQLELQDGERLGLLREYLDVVQVPLPACFLDPPCSPGPTSPGSQESGSVTNLEVLQPDTSHQPPDTHHTHTGTGAKPSRTAKQIQSVAKQFGSIGKTVSKKIRKNLGNIQRLARTGSFRGNRGVGVSQSTRRPSCRIVGGQQDHILAAMIHTQKSLPYLQEMVDNYLSEARVRFEKDRGMKVLQAEERRRRGGGEEEERRRIDTSTSRECVSPSCKGQGSARTCYLCPGCFQHQLQETQSVEHRQNGSVSPAHSQCLHYGSGRSQFYVAPDTASYESLAKVPTCKHPTLRNTGDRSIYLANSTFYQEGHIVPVSRTSPDPLPIISVDDPPPVAPARNTRRKLGTDMVGAGLGQEGGRGGGAMHQGEDRGDGLDRGAQGRQEERRRGGAREGDRRKGGGGMGGGEDRCSYMKVDLPQLLEAKPCQTGGCTFFGSSATQQYCSKCFRELQRMPQASRV